MKNLFRLQHILRKLYISKNFRICYISTDDHTIVSQHPSYSSTQLQSHVRQLEGWLTDYWMKVSVPKCSLTLITRGFTPHVGEKGPSPPPHFLAPLYPSTNKPTSRSHTGWFYVTSRRLLAQWTGTRHSTLHVYYYKVWQVYAIIFVSYSMRCVCAISRWKRYGVSKAHSQGIKAQWAPWIIT